MDKDTAIAYLTTPQGKTPSQIGEAVDVLYPDYRSYEKMAHDFRSVGKDFLRKRHHIFQLPKGIRWKIDEGAITIGKGDLICQLESEEAQWLLAFAIVEEKLDEEVCSNVVYRVLNYKDSIREALSAAAGVRCEKVIPLILPLGFDIRLAIAQKAWNLGKDWEDSCYDQICQDSSTGPGEFAHECRVLLSQVDEAMSDLLESHRSKLESLILKMDL